LLIDVSPHHAGVMPDTDTYVCKSCHHAFPIGSATVAPPTGFFNRLINRTPMPHCPKCGGTDLVAADSAPITTRVFRKKN
jgi:hypothetical protein